MYTEIGQVSEATVAELLSIIPEITWQLCERELTEVHQMAGCMEWAKEIPELIKRWPIETWEQTIFLRLRPGDHLFAHADGGWGITIPLETNKEAISFSYENGETPYGVRSEHHLKVGMAYLSDRSKRHEAFNKGSTNRTNFILIMKGA